MPITLVAQSGTQQKIESIIAALPLIREQRLIARLIISSLKSDEMHTLEEVSSSDVHLFEKLILNAIEKYDHIKVNDTDAIEKILQKDAALLME